MLANQNAIESGGYVIQNSLRFSAASSQYLSRVPSVASNQQKWTYSTWVKLGSVSLGTQQFLLNAGSNDSNRTQLTIDASLNIGFVHVTGGSVTLNLNTSALYRDPSAWLHIVIVADTTQATASDRAKIYVNGIQITNFSSSVYWAQNTNSFINGTTTHFIGKYLNGSINPSDWYQTETHFIDGQALTPSAFGEINIETGEWVAKPYTGTYGTNGFYLDFSDGTSTTTLGYDAAGSNDWTLTNFTRSAGVNDCWMKDVPAGNGEASAVQPSGNYAVLNPLIQTIATNATISIAYANLRATANTNGQSHRALSTLPFSNGKIYAEFTITTLTGGTPFATFGITDISNINIIGPGNATNSYGYSQDGTKRNNSSSSAYGASFTQGDLIGVAVDLDNGTLTFYKNNVSQGTAFTGISGTFVFDFLVFGNATPSIINANFGQRSFAYTPPTGFKALCTSNLPTPTIKRGDNHFTAKTRTGTGAAYSVSAIRHAVDWLFGKSRSAATDWFSYDVNRGVQKQLEFNTTSAETTETTGLTAFNSDGYSGGALAQMNTNGATYIDYLFKAGGAPVSNTAGSITSQVSANVTAGFSVVTYTGTGANATVGHGLGKAPKLIIAKSKNNTFFWAVFHSSLGAAGGVFLNTTDAYSASATLWGNTLPTSSVFSVGNNGNTGVVSEPYVAYCFAEIEGFSKFGSYTGNGSTDGTFVFTGFKPRWILIKEASGTQAATSGWVVHDTAKVAFNQDTTFLAANSGNAETSNSAWGLDVLSNGFKIRSANQNWNDNAGTFIYAAFAECPINYANAR